MIERERGTADVRHIDLDETMETHLKRQAREAPHINYYHGVNKHDCFIVNI